MTARTILALGLSASIAIAFACSSSSSSNSGSGNCFLTVGTGAAATCTEYTGETSCPTGTSTGTCPTSGLYGCCAVTLGGETTTTCYYSSTEGASVKETCTGSGSVWTGGGGGNSSAGSSNSKTHSSNGSSAPTSSSGQSIAQSSSPTSSSGQSSAASSETNSSGASSSMIVDGGSSESSSGSGSGSHSHHSGSHSSSEASGASSSGSGASGDAGTATCSPQTLTGFAPTADLPPATPGPCTAAEVTAAGNCFYSDFTNNTACTNAFGASGNTCYACAESMATTTSWGAIVVAEAPTSIGATTSTGLGFLNQGGCIAKEDTTSTGTACGTALDELLECEFAACLSVCPVIDQYDAGIAGEEALEGTSTSPGCMGNAETTVCLSYATAAYGSSTTPTGACTSYFTADGGVVAGSAWDKCDTLFAPFDSATAPTAAQWSAYIGELCGP